ncbi:MAG: acyl-ACP--UDP-N-acetylglucosamine O-acyltransferase [Alphaproteobacteria bacterium]|nr:acyl-ACP--UDP-N-acetylglucosamine O-acyltransferase [Alphaproteobacteria bacterium]
MAEIHATALVHPNAELADDVVIGAYVTIGPTVRLGRSVVVESHAVIDGDTEIGESTHIFPHAVIGLAPQHRQDSGAHGRVVIGGNCVIREHATIHRGTERGGGLTSVGNNCYLMVGVHVAHDCIVGNDVTMANNATLGGHVTVGDRAYLGGLAGIHQHVRIGRLAMIPAVSLIKGNVAPFALVLPGAEPLGGVLRGPNLVGLRRNGFSRTTIQCIAGAMTMLFSADDKLAANTNEVECRYPDEACVQEMVRFVQDRRGRGFLRLEARNGG